MKSLKFITTILVIAISIFFWNYQSSEIIKHKIKIAKLENKLKPNQWFLQQRTYPYNDIDRKAYSKALKYKKQKEILRSGLNWTFVGPTNIGGRITDIEIANTEPPVTFVGSASGGLFKLGENDSWIPISEISMDMSIGDIAVAPSLQSTIYVGTGEPNAGGGSLAYDGAGMYKSTNLGKSWTHLGLKKVGSIGKVIVHPNDPQTCWVGAMGSLFKNSPDQGIYKTIDGGDTWNNVLFINDSTGVIDLAINPNDPNIIYAATWQRSRKVNERNYGGSGSAIYKSTDGGENWAKLSADLPTEMGRIGLAISPSDPNIIYAVITHASTSKLLGIYKSSDDGTSWDLKNANGFVDAPYMWWFGKIWVHPTNSEIIYVASVDMFKSSNSGNSFSKTFNGVHADQHAVCFNPNDPDKVLIGNDGGVYASSNGGTFFDKKDGLPITQFYTCEINHSNPKSVFGGTQDNGTIRTNTGNEDDWKRIYGGDGFRVLVDPDNQNYIYAEYQYGNIARSQNKGISFVPAKPTNSDRNNWNSPIALDPNEPKTIYWGSHKLYKSTNRAQSWNVISGDLTTNPTQKNLTFGTLTTISVSPLNSNIIWVGTDDGNVQVTKDGGNSWTLISESLPTRWVTAVQADPKNEDGCYVTFSGYRFGEFKGHIYKTDDTGNNWSDIGGDLPDVPINDVIVNAQNQDLYIATDIGVFHSKDVGQIWNVLGNDFPNVVVSDLDYDENAKKLVAATFGRGMMALDLSDEVAVDDISKFETQVSASPNPFNEMINVEYISASIGNCTALVYDVNGKLILEKKFISEIGLQHLQFNTDHIQRGVFFINIFNETGLIVKIKVVK